MKSDNGEDPQSRHILLKKVSTNYNDPDKQPPNYWFSKRFFVAILLFFGTLHAAALTFNLSIAIIEMTSIKQIIIQNETIIEEAEFDWDSKMKGFFLSMFAYGFPVALFGANLPIKIGGSTTIGISLGISALFTVLTPIIITFNLYLYALARIIEGISQGFAFTSYSELWSKWAPYQDRSKLMALAFSGFYVGASVIFPICGFIIQVFGWPAVFYVTGGSSLVWCLLWLTCVPNDPAFDKWISKEELEYIKENQYEKKRPQNLMSVWKNILTSKSVWALCSCKFAYTMGHSFMTKSFPMYLKDVTNIEIQKIGILSAVPNILCIITVPLAGYLIDLLQRNKWTPTRVHKTFMCTGFFIGAASLFCISFSHFSFALIMLCFIMFKIILSLNFVITQIACVCLAPQCASLVAGCMTVCYSLGSIIGPMLIGFVVTDHNLEQWNFCISITGVILVISGLMHLFWGSGNPQPWSYSTNEDDNKFSSS